MQYLTRLFDVLVYKTPGNPPNMIHSKRRTIDEPYEIGQCPNPCQLENVGRCKRGRGICQNFLTARDVLVLDILKLVEKVCGMVTINS